MEKCLVSIETVKIKDYLFSTNKLKIIRGASYLLDYLNQVEVPKILEKNNISKSDILYVSAGNAKFFTEDEDTAKKIIKEVKEKYKKLAPGAKIAGSYVEVENNEKVWDLLDKLGKETAIEKNKGFSTVNIDLPFIEKCSSCNSNPVEVKKENIQTFRETFSSYYNIEQKTEDYEKLFEDDYDIKDKFLDKNKGLCLECFAKLLASKMIKEDKKQVGFYSKFRKEFQDFNFAKSIDDYKSEKSFIGFMYADGDGLGDFLKNSKENFKTKSEEDYKKFMKEFSEKLDETTKNSLIETIKDLNHLFPEKNKQKIYGEFLIVGGDDVCAVFPANIVMKISEKFQEIFNNEMKKYWEKENEKNQKIDKTNITTSSGVIIAKSKTPLHYLFDLSIELQKKAKTKRYEEFKEKANEYKDGFIDFQVIGGEGNTNISEFRKNKNDLMQRPYKVSEIKNLFELIEELKNTSFPKNKIRRFYELKLESNKLENLYEFINLISKLDDKSKKVLDKWIKNSDLSKETDLKNILDNIFDVLELYDFIKKNSNKK